MNLILTNTIIIMYTDVCFTHSCISDYPLELWVWDGSWERNSPPSVQFLELFECQWPLLSFPWTLSWDQREWKECLLLSLSPPSTDGSPV